MDKDSILKILGLLIIIILLIIIGCDIWYSDYTKEKIAKAHYEKALIYYNSGKYALAEKEFKATIKKAPYSYEWYKSYEKLEDTLTKLGKYEQAKEIHAFLPKARTAWTGKTSESLLKDPREDIKSLSSLFPYFLGLGLLFVISIAKFFGFPVSLKDVPFLMLVIGLLEFFTFLSIKFLLSPWSSFFYILHWVFTYWFFVRFDLPRGRSFFLTIGYNLIVEGVPLIVYLYFTFLG